MGPQNRDTAKELKVYAILIVGGITLLLIAGLFSGHVSSPYDKYGVPGGSTSADMQMLQLATYTMAREAAGDGKTNFGWPGDSGNTFTNWINQLVPQYLTTNDILHAFSTRTNRLTQVPQRNDTPILVYAVGQHSPTNTVFLSTANFINTPQGGYIDPTVQPFGDKAFMVMRKDGSCSLLKPRDAGRTNKVGSFAPLCH